MYVVGNDKVFIANECTKRFWSTMCYGGRDPWKLRLIKLSS